MAPTSKKLRAHIALGLFVRDSIRHVFGACDILGTMYARVFKLWIPHEK